MSSQLFKLYLMKMKIKSLKLLNRMHSSALLGLRKRLNEEKDPAQAELIEKQ